MMMRDANAAQERATKMTATAIRARVTLRRSAMRGSHQRWVRHRDVEVLTHPPCDVDSRPATSQTFRRCAGRRAWFTCRCTRARPTRGPKADSRYRPPLFGGAYDSEFCERKPADRRGIAVCQRPLDGGRRSVQAQSRCASFASGQAVGWKTNERLGHLGADALTPTLATDRRKSQRCE